ncbi:alpha-amylase family glycosyl hydrolase [Athalassotoga sp.]|uniref:alpha-amylase family glycosyl hydrolase n=1 Tax=Athalassotoga sp. TaxID=2022597 RepID=UPI003D049D70
MKKISLFIFIFLIVVSFAFSKDVLFAYQGDANTKSVAVIGTFNDWSATADIMTNTFGNIWMKTINLPDGVYYYDFLVDGQIISDPANPKTVPNDKGGYYSLITVGNYTLPTGKLGSGIIHKNYIHFDQNSFEYLDPASTKTIYFSFETLHDDVDSATLDVNGSMYSMKRIVMNQYTDIFRSEFHPTSTSFNYKFLLQNGTTKVEIGSSGIATSSNFFFFDFASPTVRILSVPKWSQGAVVYEIFPERFWDGNPSNNPPGTLPWGGTPTNTDFFGGDLRGIIDHLDYLKSLDINELYTTPIFEAPSNHKYDTQNYMEIDPHFGTLKTFEELSGDLNKDDIHWILDGVFNHTGTQFFAFQNLLKYQQNSPYKDWYFVLKYPVIEMPGYYRTFQDYASLPKLNVMNPDVQKYLKGVIDYWTSKGISGWRIDSANVIANQFLVDLYGWIHEVNPDSLDVAEIWTNTSQWFDEGAFNSVMNYLFQSAAYNFIIYGSGANAFVNNTNSYLNTYPPQLWNSLWNLIDSQDTPRALTAANGDLNKMMALVGLQMTFPGAPMIYYGDEIGMTGGNDPLNRGCMIWDKSKWNMKLFDWYKLLINIHETNPALRYGNYLPIVMDKDVLGFERTYEGQTLYVFINGGSTVQKVSTPLYGKFENLVDETMIGGSESGLNLTMQPYQVMILEIK